MSRLESVYALAETLRDPEFAPLDNAPGELFRAELFWRDRERWLEDRGYKLRPRYHVDWVPSWKGTKKHWEQCEDGQGLLAAHVMDATRISDKAPVVLKRIKKSTHPYEADIGTFLSSAPLAADARNHCIPSYEVLPVPDSEDYVLIVMPLMRKYNDPQFLTVGEAVDFFQQVFEGLQFMHEHNIAHRDCNGNNIMMDPKSLYPDFYHPVKTDRSRDLKGPARHLSRTQRPPKYYFVDFGLSRQYTAEERPPSEPVIRGGDKSPPEHQILGGSCDPFPTDVYFLGNMIREDFLKTRTGLDFMAPLVADMTHDEPSKRPSMDQVVARYAATRTSLGTWKLRARVASRREFYVIGLVRNVLHLGRQFSNSLKGLPAIPTKL